MNKNESTEKYKTYYMTGDNIKKIDEHAKNTGLKKSTIVNQALKLYFEKGDKNGS